MAASGSLELGRGNLAEPIYDSFANRATSTLHCRAGPLIKYISYWKERNLKPFPVQEPMVYEYIKAHPEASPSAPRSLLIALSFAYYVLGLEGGNVAENSGRVKGVFCRRKKIIQKDPLKVEQVMALEAIVHDGDRSVYDRIAARYFLFLTYRRLRYSDALYVSDVQLDEIPECRGGGGFLEARAEKTKTSTTLERKVRFLPIAIPLVSFGEPCWVQKWVELREMQGLVIAKGTPLLPSPTHGGGWAKVPLQVGPAGDWLRSLLKEQGMKDGKFKVATHSCKATLLSQAAKFGVEARARRTLGYHTAGKDKSLVIYSRDEMATPLRKLTEMILAIKTNQFYPDRTRSGYFATAGGEGEDPCEDDKDDSLSLVSDATSETSGSGSECDEDDAPEDDEAALEKVAGSWSPNVEVGECV